MGIRALGVIAATLLCGCILAGCASAPYRGADDYYMRFLGFAECWIAYAQGIQACEPEEATKLRMFLRERREHFVAESKDANWGVRYQNIQAMLWVWLGQQRDSGFMTDQQYQYLANLLVSWR